MVEMRIIPGRQSSTELKSAKHHSSLLCGFFTSLFPAHIMLTLLRFVGPPNFPRFLSRLAILVIFMTS